MTSSARVPTPPRARPAVLSLCPSTPPQVLPHPARLPRHSARRHRALPRGGREEDRAGMAADVGCTAVTAAPRSGCTALVAPVPRRQGGRRLALAVPQRARPLTAWAPLLAIGGSQGGRLADRDGGDAPAPPHGRGVGGWTGPLAALELQTRRARRRAGRLQTAARGARALALPLGRGRAPGGPGPPTAPLAVPQRRAGLCAPGRRVRTARQG